MQPTVALLKDLRMKFLVLIRERYPIEAILIRLNQMCVIVCVGRGRYVVVHPVKIATVIYVIHLLPIYPSRPSNCYAARPRSAN